MAGTITSVDPATGAVIASYNTDNAGKVNKALKQAQKTFEEWRGYSLKERGAVLKQIAAELRKQKQKLAELATREMGKPIQQSLDEVEKCARTFDFYAKQGPKFLADELIETDARKSYISFQPLGVVLAIMPWNFPYWQVFRAMGPALMAGNTMLLKHASNVSGCALAIEKVIKAAGAPKGLFQTLLLPSSEVAGLIADPAVSAITFTGSTYAGSQVASVAAAHVKKTGAGAGWQRCLHHSRRCGYGTCCKNFVRRQAGE